MPKKHAAETLVETDPEDEEGTDSEATVSTVTVSVLTVLMNDNDDSLNDIDDTPVVVEETPAVVETNMVHCPWCAKKCCKTGLGRDQFYCPKNPNKITVNV